MNGQKVEIPTIAKYRRRYKKFPEEAGWVVQDFQKAASEGTGLTKHDYHLEFGAIAQAIGVPYDDLDIETLTPEDAVQAVMLKKDRKNYDWERFRSGRWNMLRHLKPL